MCILYVVRDYCCLMWCVCVSVCVCVCVCGGCIIDAKDVQWFRFKRIYCTHI